MVKMSVFVILVSLDPDVIWVSFILTFLCYPFKNFLKKNCIIKEIYDTLNIINMFFQT